MTFTVWGGTLNRTRSFTELPYAAGDADLAGGWSDDESTDDYQYELGTLTTPIPFWRIVAEAQYVMTRRGVTLAQVLHHLLQFTASIKLDNRLAGYVSSSHEWLHLKAVAG